jgi:integrase
MAYTVDEFIEKIREIGDKEGLIVEPGPRGAGRLACRVRNRKADFYYQYDYQGNRERIPLGRFKDRGTTGISLGEAREKANDLSRLKRDHPGLKGWLAEEERRHKRAQELVDQQASFGDLLDAYLEKLRRENKASYDRVTNNFNCYIKRPWPSLLQKKAKEIEPADISEILARMIDHEITTTSNRLRSQLHAAFSYALEAEYDPRKRLGRLLKFGLTHNPVGAIPVQTDWERVGERCLSENELKQFWGSLPGKMAPQTALFFQFLIATGGQRPTQVLAAPWADYELDQRYFEQINAKAKAKGQPHLTPLNGFAWAIVQQLLAITGDCRFPFAGNNLNPNKPLTVMGASSALSRHIADQGLAHFTMRDLRRTVKTHMKKSGLGSEITERIQARVFGDVGSRHYDKHDYLEEKRTALELWQKYLQQVIEGNARDENIVQFKRA